MRNLTAFIKRKHKVAKNFILWQQFPLIMPWFRYYKGNDIVSRLNDFLIKTEQKSTNPILIAIKVALFPLLMVRIIALGTLKEYKVVKDIYGVALWRQIYDQIKLIFLYNIGPMAYYECALYLEDRRGQWQEYFSCDKFLHLITPLRSGKEGEIDNKLTLYEHCQKLNISMVPTFAFFDKGELKKWYTQEEKLPKVDFCLKATNRGKGIGVELWLYDATKESWSRKGVTFDAEKFLKYCQHKSKSYPQVLQPRLMNDSFVGKYSKQALSTFRITTYMSRSRMEVKIVDAAIKMPLGVGDTDNVSQGGMYARVDYETATLHHAYCADMTKGVFHNHPDTGHKITGEKIPRLGEILRLCQQAHSAFNFAVFIGWDIALTPDKAMIIEANSNFGHNSTEPITSTILPDWFAEAARDRGFDF